MTKYRLEVFVLLFTLAIQYYTFSDDKELSVKRDKLQSGTMLFQENFEDIDFSSRGWYDSPAGILSTTEHIAGSKSSLECKFLKGARTPEGRTPGRHLFEETEEFYLSYYVKYSANYTGSNKPFVKAILL